MKNKFLSKSVPRGTRTIWRYLGALFLLFTFAIGNVWGAETEIIKSVLSGSNGSTQTVTGSIGGTSAVNNLGSSSPYKLNSDGAYVSITLASGYFQATDFLELDGSKAMQVYYGTPTSGTLLLTTTGPTDGKIRVKLKGLPANQNTIYVYRSSSTYNGTLTYMSVKRPDPLPTTGTGTVTYSLISNSANVEGEATVSTITADDASFTTSNLTVTSGNSKAGYSGQIKGFTAISEYNASYYVALSFSIASGYTFEPSAVSLTIFANSCTPDAKVVISDGETTIESNTLTCSSSADAAITFAAGTFTAGKKFSGDVTIKVYFWGASGDKRAYIKSPVTITGTVASAAPKYDVIFDNGGEGTGSMATLKYEADEEVTLPACGYTPVSGREFDGWTSSDVTISAGKFTMPSKNVTITATWRDEAVKYTVTYDVNGGSSATPTETDKAAGDEFALAAAPEYEGYHFEGWLCDADAATYDAEDAYTMTAANTTFTAQWKPYSTISIANKTYIIGIGDFNAVSDFSSNCEAAVIYELKESYPGVTLTPAGVFSATAAGEYIVVANQAGDATYAATSKEFTVTVLDNELSDTYVWKKGTGYTGCVASPNADAPAAQYTDVTVEGMSAVSSGRPSTAGTTVTITFSVKAAYSSLFGIENICTYGKLEEPAGGQISWDGGTNWEDLAAYTEGKKEFAPAAGTFPTSFKIKFVGVSTSSGGLWWRNALVTLEVKKTVTGVTEALVGAEINGEAISAANLSTLQEDKTLDIATAYAAAPTVTFKKQVTTSYEGGWPADVENVDVEVTASDNTSVWQASATIGGQAYTINLAKPAGPSLETEATAFTLTSAKIATDSKNFTFSGVNLAHNVTIALESDVAGMSVTPAVVIPIENAITDQEVTITYKSLENVDEAVVNLIVAYDEDTKITIPLTYSSTAGYEELTSISAATTWNWDGAASAAYETLGQNDMIILANADVTWDEGFNARAIAGKLQHYYRDGKYAQGDELKFNTTIPGKVYVTYSNTGGNAARTVNVNGVKGSLTTAGTGEKHTEAFLVSAGDVLIKGVQVSDDAAKMLRYYEVRFAPVFAVTYGAGEGSVKGGETMPTQADEAAGEKIVLAAATALEKDGYDFAGWLCNIDAQTYQPDDEYTMTAAATTFTAQWVLHVEPVDPTLTYDEGAYMVGGAALDLSSLITAQTSTGAITYNIKDAGTTGATLEGKNFSATAAGTAVITASQEAVLGYNAITVDFNVVVTEATEIDGIKMVENNALTGNFRVKADQLKTGAYTVEGINYSKYVQMGSTHTSFSGETEGNQAKGIYYAPAKKNIKFWFYMRNTESTTTRKIYIYTIEEGESITSQTVEVEAGSHLVSADITLSKNAEIVFGVDNTKLCFCQIVAVESGDDLLQGGQAGYVFDYSKKRQNVAQNVVRTIDGIDYKLSAESKINSASNVQLTTLGTHYIKFHLDAPMTVNVFADNKKYYVGSECSTEDAAMTYEATGDGEFTLAAGNWYINASGNTVKINKLSFMLPRCQKPTISAQPETNQTFGPGNMTATVVANVNDGGTLKYQWYDATTDEEVENATEATLTTTAEGTYYVIVTNTLADHSDNSIKSEEATLGYRVTDDATLKSLSASAGALDPTFDKNVVEYRVDLPEGTVDVPTLTAKATMDGYATVAINNASAFVDYEATSTVVVTSEDGTATKTYTVKFVVDHIYTALVDVTESTTWNWTGSVEAVINDVANKGLIIANYIDGANFEMIEGKENERARRNQNGGVYQGTHLHFNTTVAGKVKFYFRAPSSGENCTITVINNGKEMVAGTRGNSFGWSKEIVVKGDVVIEMVNDKSGGGETRVQQIVFTELTPDYTRNVSNNIGTLCVDHNVLVGGAMGATFYQIASRNELYNDKIDFEEVLPNEELKAGEPYIFKSTTGKIELYYGETEADAPAAVRGMIGSFVDAQVDITEENKSDILYIAQNKLWNCEDLVGGHLDVVENRAYIVMSDVPTYADYQAAQTSNPAPRRRVTLGKDAEQVVTGVENLNASEQPVKLLINGQIFILRGEKLFDATGRLVK